MIKDLENVTVLWEELWLSTLQELHAGSQDVDLEDFLQLYLLRSYHVSATAQT